jgi:transcriptional regulator with XRE-family HTH domain
MDLLRLAMVCSLRCLLLAGFLRIVQLWERILSLSSDIGKFFMSIGERLREERNRLGMSQPVFAEIAGTTKQTLFSWESEKTAPDGFQMAALATAGVDVLYVVTGQRSQPVAPQALLPEGDRILLDNFHAAPAQVQAGVKTTLGAFAPAAGQVKSRKKAA